MAIEDFYLDTITLTHKTMDEFGEPASSTTTTPRARVVIKDESVETSTGAEYKVKGLAWLTETTLDNSNKYTVTYDSVEYSIAFIDKQKAFSSNTHHFRLGLA